jgi:DNA polymerase-1
VIAAYARAFAATGGRVTIVSSDKDLMQLINARVIMLDPIKQKPIREAEVFEKFGVTPDKVVEIQALAGDPTDNVPGVPGIGIKTAAQLITEYGDLESLLARAHEIKQPKRRETCWPTPRTPACRAAWSSSTPMRRCPARSRSCWRSRRKPRASPASCRRTASAPCWRGSASARGMPRRGSGRRPRPRRRRSWRTRRPRPSAPMNASPPWPRWRAGSPARGKPAWWPSTPRRTAWMRWPPASSASASPPRPGQACYVPLRHAGGDMLSPTPEQIPFRGCDGGAAAAAGRRLGAEAAAQRQI